VAAARQFGSLGLAEAESPAYPVDSDLRSTRLAGNGVPFRASLARTAIAFHPKKLALDEGILPKTS
jgi:hypothetical protein